MAEQNVADVPAQYAAEDFDGGNDFSGDDGGVDGAGQPAPGTGQSKSSRRRRRKRKNKTVGPGATGTGAAGTDSSASGPSASAEDGAAPAPFVMEGESLALAATAQPVRRPNPPQPQAGNNGQGGQGAGQAQGQGGKRWKKKFRDRERRGRSDSPGNEVRPESNGSGGGSYAASNGSYGGDNGHRGGGRPDNFGNLVNGFKRKGKGGSNGGGQQRKERGFVGPMDHSYREGEGVNAPPSTIQLHGSHSGRRGHRHQGDNQPIDRSMPAAIPIPENAQTHIYFFVEDLFITAKVTETARKQGIKVAFIKNEKEALAELTSGEDTNRPALIVFDLNNLNAKPLTLIPKLKTKLKRSASIIGFLSSIQGDLKAKAMEAGCDTVMPRAAFSQNLPNLLRRYGVEEAEEVNYNF